MCGFVELWREGSHLPAGLLLDGAFLRCPPCAGARTRSQPLSADRDNAAKPRPGDIAQPPQTIEPESLDPMSEPMPPAPKKRTRDRMVGEQGLTADGRLKAGRLAGLTMTAAIWTVSWPMLVDLFLNAMVGLTDTVVAASISAAAADAIGNAAYTLWFCGTFLIALDVGATALISRSIGGRRFAVANATLGQSMLLAVAIGIALGAFLFAVSGPVAWLMRMTPEAEHHFVTFLRIAAADLPFMAIMYAGIACLRGSGDTFRPMRAMIVVNIVNLLLSWTLSGADLWRPGVGPAGEEIRNVIIHNPSPFHMGVPGIALGMMLGHATGAAVIVWTLFRGTAGLVLKRHRLKPHWHTMRRVLRIGLPNFMETLGMWLGNFPIILMAGWIGQDLVGAHNLAIRIEAFSFQPGFAIGIAAASLAGQYLGAGSPRMAKKAVVVCCALSSTIMGLMGLLFIFYGREITGLLSPQKDHLDVTPQCLFITGLVQVPFAVSLVLRQAMRGAGDVKVVMWITWITTYAIRLPLAYAMSGVVIKLPGGGEIANPFPPIFADHPTLAGLWAGLCVEVVFRSLFFIARFVQGGWAKVRV